MISFFRSRIGVGIVAALIICAGALAGYLLLTAHRVFIDEARVSAPIVALSPTSPGRLNAIYVHVGDQVDANAPLFLVGTEVVTSKLPGLVVSVNNIIGAQVGPGTAVVSIIHPGDLRVVGKVDENKGLSQIAVGDPVAFTADAFGSRTYRGVVDEVAPTSNESDIVFSISDKRQEQTFNVKVRYDVARYPELRNGMSARLWIYQP